MHGNFTWVDLSTINLSEAKTFYHAIFQWDFDADESGYLNCTRSSTPSAGLYEMPEFFQKIRMPSFWMTYISVSDIDAVVAKAAELGGKIELEETNALGRVALIRDPAGAGFTCYEGGAQSAITPSPQHGRWDWSELFVSDLSKIERFYSELFNWTISEDPDSADRHLIHNHRGKLIGSVQVADNDIKGDKEFWAVCFGTRDLDQCLAQIRNAGGEIIYEHHNSKGKHYLAKDSQGAAFFVSAQHTDTQTASTLGQRSARGNLKWRSIVGLIMIYLAVFLEFNWLWGILFLIWVIPDLKSGTTYFIEPLSRRQNPILYWAVILTWISLSAYILIAG